MRSFMPVFLVWSVFASSAWAQFSFSWNEGNVDGWMLANEKPADRVSFQERSDRGAGEGCLVIDLPGNWCIAAVRPDLNPAVMENVHLILFDVYANPSDFAPPNWCQVGFVVHSSNGEWDQLGLEPLEPGKWKTMSFSCDGRQHADSSWLVLNLIANSGQGGKILIDNIRTK